MRRSRSYSNIPLPTFRKHSSNENLANTHSSQKPKQSLTRSNSSNHLSVPKLSYPRNDLVLNSLQSACRSASKRITATPVRTVGNGSVCSKLVTTPFSSSKVLPSPCVILKTELINDKKFSSDQYRKICTFMQEKLNDFDPKTLKPLSLTSFVQTISILFMNIDPRIKIDMANYKEVVFKYLKLFKYPGPVSMSLLKSVNTNISWPQVMSIFGWLVDLIYQFSTPTEEDSLQKYILCKANNAIRSGYETEKSFIEFIEKELQFDTEEYEGLECQVETLRQKAEDRKKLTEGKENTEKTLLEQYEKMKSEIKEFKEGNLEEKIKNELSALESELQNKAVKITEMKESNKVKQQIISNQKYTLKEKKDMMQKLEDNKFSLSLKKAELEGILQLIYEYDHELTNTRRQIETEVHKINGRIVQLNLGNIMDDAKKLRLPDRGIHTSNFKEEFEEKKVLLENVQTKIILAVEKAQNSLSVKKMQLNELCDKIQNTMGEIDSTKKKNAEIANEMSRILFEFDVVSKQNEKKLKKLQLQLPDIESLKKMKLDLQEEVSSLTKRLNRLNQEFIEIFHELKAKTEEEAKTMRSIMDDFTKKKLACYQLELDSLKELDKMLKVKNNLDF